MKRKIGFITLLFVLWKVIDTFASYLATHLIPYLGNFSYGDQMRVYKLPLYLRALSNFDGIFYIRIALHGYSTTEQAYFPFYPMMLSLIHRVIHNPILAGLAVSLLSYYLALIFWRKLYPSLIFGKDTWWPFLFLLISPFSFYFGVLYTESLFLVLLVGCLCTLTHKKFLLACILGYLAGLTRFIGLFLFVPLATVWIGKILEIYQTGEGQLKIAIQKSWKYCLVAIAPALGLLSYCAYLWKIYGDPLLFFHAQESFNNNRSRHLILPLQVIYRYYRIFLTADFTFQYGVAVIEFIFYIAFLYIVALDLIKILRRKNLAYMRLGLNLFSIANLIVPSLTGTLTAVPRYGLLSLSVYLYLSEIQQPWVRYSLLGFFAVLHLLLIGFFIQGYYLT